MPHFIVECTENIRQEARLPELFASVNTALAATGIFPLGGIRSRALKIGSGRSLESRQEVGEMLFDLIKTHFASLMESRYLALSFEIAELHPTLNFKQNNVHALFK